MRIRPSDSIRTRLVLGLGFALAVLALVVAPAAAAETQTVAFVGQAILSGPVADVAASGTTGYVVGAPDRTGTIGPDVLRVLDASDPSRAREVGRLDLAMQANAVTVQGGLAYVTGEESVYAPGQLVVVDVSSSSAPRRLASITTARGLPGRPAIDGQYLYVFSKNFNSAVGTLEAFDLASPGAPARVGSQDLGVGQAEVGALAVAGGRAYVTGDNGLLVVDVSDPSQPRVVSTYTPPAGSNPRALAVQAAGRYAYVVTYTYPTETTLPHTYPAWLRVVDASDPIHPLEVGAVELARTVNDLPRVDLRADGTTVAATVSPGGLRVVNAADPTHPTLAATSSVPERPRAVAVAGGLTYIAEGAILRIVRAPAATVATSELARQAYLPVVLQGVTWVSGPDVGFVTNVAVQNRGSAAARAAILLLNPDGSAAAYAPIEVRVLPGANVLVDLASRGDLPRGRYVAVVVADEPISAQANLFGNSFGPLPQGASHDAIPIGAADATLDAPGLFRRYVGLYTSTITLHNPTAVAARATLTYHDATGATVANESRTIPAGGTVDVGQGSSPLPDGFVGGARVATDQPLVGTVHVAGAGGELSGTGLFGAPSRYFVVAIPQAYKNYSADGWISSILLQNVGSAPTSVTLTFRPYGSSEQFVLTDTIPANGARQYYQGNQADLPDGFAGSVVVRADASSIVATVNTRNVHGNLSTIAGAPANATASGLTFPALYNNYSSLGWSSSFVLQNPSERSVEATISYYDWRGLVRSYTEGLGPFEARLHYQPDPREGLPPGFRGSAVVTGVSVGAANILATAGSTGDWLLSYEGLGS